VKAVIRDGEELPASGGATERRPLKLSGAPPEIVAMVARSGGRAECQECARWFESSAGYVNHGCRGRVQAWWLPGKSPPAKEGMLRFDEFIEAVPARLLDEDDSEQCEGDGWEVPERVRQYVARHPDASVPAVLGRFELPPDRAERVASL